MGVNKFTPGCCNCSCPWNFEINNCAGNPENIATVKVISGGSTVATCTTNISGQCSVTITLGTYDLEVDPPANGEATYTASGVSFSTCNQTTTIGMSPSTGNICANCGCAGIPSTLYLSGSGFYACVVDTLTWNSGISTWVGTYYNGSCVGGVIQVNGNGTSIPGCPISIVNYTFSASTCVPYHAAFTISPGNTVYLDG